MTALNGFDVETHLRHLEQQGYTLIEDFLDKTALARVREGLAPFLGTHAGRNNFEGEKTERVYTLVARGPVFEDLVEDARVLALLDRLLQPGYLLTASQAICIHPGETPQPIHADDMFYRIPRPRPPISISTIVAVDAFTRENGGTQIIPASHRWSNAQVGETYDGQDNNLPTSARLETQLQTVEMPAGACIVFLGTLLHRGGPNRSSAPRLAFSNQYCEPWARTQENFYLGVPATLARQMSPRVQDLLGYNIWPPFMGQVTASHPLKALSPDWVAPVVAQTPHT
jgi:ectoine hydroxylase-related dioxygenase (phytanoyl-CoA dioxygenase family)